MTTPLNNVEAFRKKYPNYPYQFMPLLSNEAHHGDHVILGYMDTATHEYKGIEVSVYLLDTQQFWILADRINEECFFEARGPFDNPDEAIVMLKLLATPT